MKKIRLILLYPIGAIFGLIALIRRALYNRKGKRDTTSTMPTICIGNLAVGGTGKTPHTEYLVQMLSETCSVATLSRGYGRATTGYILADAHATARTIGDEPLQMKLKFPGTVVAVCEQRAVGLQQLSALPEPPDVVILDDAYQHLAVRGGLQLVLTDYAAPYCDDFPLPAGNLREFARAAAEADAVVVTKCPPDLDADSAAELRQRLHLHEGQRCFFTTLHYENIRPLTPAAEKIANEKHATTFLVTGIAHPEHILHYFHLQNIETKLIAFSDHHEISQKEAQRVCKKLASSPPNSIIVTTEKDAARMRGTAAWEVLSTLPVFCLPVRVKFLWDKDEFRCWVTDFVSRGARYE